MAGGFGHDGSPTETEPMESADEGATLLRPPPKDPAKAPIENMLEVTEMSVLGPVSMFSRADERTQLTPPRDIFTNTRRPWHPPGARGIYGGVVIAQCLAAAQRTVADAALVVHSCHCYFLLAGSADMALLFHVERVRDGRSFATRTVQARQRGRCIFTTTISFVRAGAGGRDQVRHAAPLPGGAPEAPGGDEEEGGPAWERRGPFRTARAQVVHAGRPDERRCRQWMRARGRIAGATAAHLSALAYMSDSYFIGTVARIYRLWRFPFAPGEVGAMEPSVREAIASVNALDGVGAGADEWAARPRLGMLVSLDHSIYFHAPQRVRADEWMLADMESPWAGDGRGVVVQRVFASDGTLLATCVQEGVVRLKQEEGGGSKL